jgi:hypothetical protein
LDRCLRLLDYSLVLYCPYNLVKRREGCFENP